MVVAFVGFVGGWGQHVLGDALFAGGALAATVVTFFTFLPSFLFILLGAPFIESTHGQLHFTAPLTGITAAVVGVIVNLAVFFAIHVWWPSGLEGAVDVPSVLIAVAALIALMRFKLGVIPVIVACGLAGLALRVLT
jgi:chromate transporter